MARKKKAEAPAVPPANPKLEAEVAAIVAAKPPPPPDPKPPAVRYTLAETREHLRAVEELLIEGARVPLIHRTLRGRFHSITLKRVKTLAARVREEWSLLSGDEKQRAADREAAIRRVQRMRQHAAGQLDPKDPTGRTWLRAPDHKAVAAYEKILMDLQGTREAAKVDVDVRYTEAMLHVMGSLQGEAGQELLEEALEQARLADVARRELPAFVQEAEVVPTDPAGSVRREARA